MPTIVEKGSKLFIRREPWLKATDNHNALDKAKDTWITVRIVGGFGAHDGGRRKEWYVRSRGSKEQFGRS